MGLAESKQLKDECRRNGIHPIVLVSPNVPADRLATLTAYASGMVYTTARVGTTGAATDVDEEALQAYFRGLRETFELPLAVGFGIRSRSQVVSRAGAAEVAVVGTQLLRALDAGGAAAVTDEVKALAGK